jgi:alpha-glucosidase
MIEHQKMIEQLKSNGFHTVVILDPGVKTEPGYAPFDEGMKEQIFATYPDGELYEGEVWPGWSAFPDFTSPDGRAWWGKYFKELTDVGLEGFWNDMNEPAAWGQHMPELIEFDYEGEKATLKKARNVYGMQMARATFEAAKKELNHKRPFVLTRAGYSGIQRFAAVWTGDNTSSDEHMLAGVRLVNSMGLAGIANAGYDIGGFAGECSPELYARWISIGAFSPFFRSHAMINSRDSEPWSFGEETEDISRNFVMLRYQLMPYIYSCFYEAHKNGMPVARSLAIDYSFDQHIYSNSYQNQYLFGHAIMVCPIASNKEFARVYLPAGNWYQMLDDKKFEGLSEEVVEIQKEILPLFIKAGSIITMQSTVQHLKEKPDNILRIHVYAGDDNSFVYYEDDGETYAYEQGLFYKREITLSEQSKEIIFHAKEGSYETHFKQLKIYLHGFEFTNNQIMVNEKTVDVLHEDISFLEALSNFDPYNKPPRTKDIIKDCAYLVIANDHQLIHIITNK